MSVSAVSGTTAGGVDFDQLCTQSIKSYSFNLADIGEDKDVNCVEQLLIEQLETTVDMLELHSDRQVGKIYIGKTFIKSSRRKGLEKFDPINHRTWIKKGISSRWREHRNNDYGRHGLVVLGAITRKTMPKRIRSRVHQEDFTLAMEQKLLHHYLLSHPDSRVVNKTFATGRTTEHKCIAYAIYMAFSFSNESTTNSDDESIGKSQKESYEVEQEQSVPPSPSPAFDNISQLWYSQTSNDREAGQSHTFQNNPLDDPYQYSSPPPQSPMTTFFQHRKKRRK